MRRFARPGLAATCAIALLALADAIAGPVVALAGPTVAMDAGLARAPGAEAPFAEVPDVTGQTLDAAREILAAAELAANPDPPDADDDWIVLRQVPAAGQSLPAGDEVLLLMSPPEDPGGAVETDEPDPGDDPDEPDASPDEDDDPSGLVAPILGLVLLVAVVVLVRNLARGRDDPGRDDPPDRPRIRAVSHPDRSPVITIRERPR